MSSTLMIAPCSSMKATDSGISVFFIHMQCVVISSKMKSMPALDGIEARCMSPGHARAVNRRPLRRG